MTMTLEEAKEFGYTSGAFLVMKNDNTFVEVSADPYEQDGNIICPTKIDHVWLHLLAVKSDGSILLYPFDKAF